MKVGINEAQELKKLAQELEIPFANLLRAYVLEDLMLRIYSSDYQEHLWIRDDRMLGEAGCRRGGEDRLSFYYIESDRPIPEDKPMPGQKLGPWLAEALAAQVLQPQNRAGVLWQSESSGNADRIQLTCHALYKEMKVPVTLELVPLAQENQRPEKRTMDAVTMPKKVLTYWAYSAENQLGQDLFQIMDKLELIGDMGAYYRVYRTLCAQTLSGRYILEELQAITERAPRVKCERRLAQLRGYRSYAYMRKRWNQYVKRHSAEAVPWEDALDLILAMLAPIWQCLCQNEIFFDDWMPELGRYM